MTGALFFENHERIALALQGQANEAVDGVAREYDVPPLRYLAANARVSDGNVAALRITLQARENETLDLTTVSASWVSAASEPLELGLLGDPGLGFQRLRGSSDSLEILEGDDLAMLDLRLGDLGIALGPHQQAGLLLAAGHRPPLQLKVQTPPVFEAGGANVDVTVA